MPGSIAAITSFVPSAELKNALRSGDIWVQGSRQFKDFDEYLVAGREVRPLKAAGELPLAVDGRLRRFLDESGWRRSNSNCTGSTTLARPPTTSRCDPHRLGPEDHAARHSVPHAAQTLIEQIARIAAARQDHRPAAGSGRLDRLHQAASPT